MRCLSGCDVLFWSDKLVSVNSESRVNRKLTRSAFLLLGIALSTCAWANVGIAGPLMHYSASLSSSPWQWIGVTMFMCVGVEAAVYAYSGQYKKPVLASLYANVISLIFGIPFGLLALVDPTPFALPTIASIVIEYWSIQTRRNWFEAKQDSITQNPIILGNILSNLILVGLIILVVKR